jgi:hypothetical protein
LFSKSEERLRQWSLLGVLLRRLPLVEALDFLDLSHPRSPVPWARIRRRASEGGSLLEIAKEAPLKTPPAVLRALESGEPEGQVPEALSRLSMPEPAVPPGDDSGNEGFVMLADRIQREALERGANRIRLTRSAQGGVVDVTRGDTWTETARLSAPEFAGLVRRFWILAGQPYWAPGPGFFRARTAKGIVEWGTTPDGKGGLMAELRPSP